MATESDDTGRALAIRLYREYNTVTWAEEDDADVRLPLADDYLARIRERVLAAQTGGWRVDRGAAIGENWLVATGAGYGDTEPGSWAVATAGIPASHTVPADGLDDAAFIAHCRLDVPLLLLEIERLRASIAALEGHP